jgi:hypothetical protein
MTASKRRRQVLIPRDIGGRNWHLVKEARKLFGPNTRFHRRTNKRNHKMAIVFDGPTHFIGWQNGNTFVIEGSGGSWADALSSARGRMQRNTMQNWPQWATETPQVVEGESAQDVHPEAG